MARWGLIMFVALVVAHEVAAARVMPAGGDIGLTDQKNFMNFGGIGGYSGIGDNGIPFGGIGGGAGSTAGGINGGGTGFGGIIGTGPNGGLTGVYGTVPGGIGTIGSVGPGGGVGGGGTGVLPFP